MSFLLFAVAALHVLILLLLFVITLDKGWWVLPDAEKLNLWYDCVFQNSTQSWLCASVANSRLAVLVGAGLYAAQGGHPPGGHFGHCFVLAWLCGPLALASGVTYGHLRKRE
ncbi:epithelial membrane protein 3 isoform X3 [Ciconia boyciana]|uniref:epithelial membrane protein 3 isoform X3 n=1 Tax=Ciconia boyciana TaxID=52775 RepID=UPI003BA119CC